MTTSAADWMKLLGNERRLDIITWLADPVAHFPPQQDGDLVEDGVCLLFIADKLKITQPSTSKHMDMLASAGLVTSKPVGRWTFYKRHDAKVAEAMVAIKKALLLSDSPP